MGGTCSAYGENRSAYRVFGRGKLRERDHLGDLVVDGRIISRWIFRKCDVGVWNGLVWLRMCGHL